MTRTALYGFLGSGNLGNDASFEAMLERLRHDPRQEVRAITIAPDVVAERYGIAAAPLRSPRGRLADVLHAFALVKALDAVAVPGMGVLEETLGARPWGLPFWLFLIALAARVRGRRFALVAVGAEPVRNPITRWLFRATVRLADPVSYRDAWSAAALGVDGRVAPDIAFAHPALARPATPPMPGTVLVGVLDYHGWSDDRVGGAAQHAAYVDRVAGLVGGLLDRGDRVLLTGGDRVDDDCAAQVRDAVRAERPEASSRVELRPAASYDELVALVDEAEAVVGTRFHTLVAALSRGRPTATIAYAEKNARLLEWFGIVDAAQPIDDWQPDALLARLDKLRADPDLPAVLSARAAEASRDAGRLLDDVAAELS